MHATVSDKQRHYELEKEIAARLRQSTREERRELYSWAYDRIYTEVPGLRDEAMHKSPSETAKEVASLTPLVNSNSVYLELGPGGFGTALAMARKVRDVIAVDVTRELSEGLEPPPNFELMISDGTSIPVPDDSVDVVYSNQLMEHLHPDDAETQLREVFRVLKPGGRYFCVTPNRLTGPHDISRDFDNAATGLHLREYSSGELDRLFASVGFRKRRVRLCYRTSGISFPVWPPRAVESVLDALPPSLRKLLTHNRVVTFLMGIKFLAVK